LTVLILLCMKASIIYMCFIFYIAKNTLHTSHLCAEVFIFCAFAWIHTSRIYTLHMFFIV
jgi:hypothetical protein